MSPMSSLREALAAGGAPVTLAPAAAAALGARADVELAEDPWRLLAVPGVRPDQADAYARARLGPAARPDDPRRARALVCWLLERAARDGHSAVPAARIRRALPAFGFADADAALARAVAEGAVLALDGAGDSPGDGEEPLLLALDEWAMAEESLAEGVARLLATARNLGPGDPGAEYVRAAATSGVSLAILETASEAETLVAALAGFADTAGQRLLVAAATGGEARRLREATGAPAATTRELTGGGQVAADLVVVTEAGALDVASVAALVEALPDGVHLVLAGDPAALASPGPGQVLADLAESGLVPVSAVPAPQGATLARLVAGIRAGMLPRLDSPGRDVVIVPARDAGEAAHRAVQLVADSIPRALGIPVDGVLVVTPRRGGRAGADGINAACKHRLNPGPGKFGGFDPGDRVVVTSQSCAVAPYGEIGVVVGGTDASLDVDFNSGPATVPMDGGVRHGWAVTGQHAGVARWPAVVAVFPGEAAGSLSRASVLSAVGPALRHLSVVHAAGPVLAHAVARTPRRVRITSGALRASPRGALQHDGMR
jgi:hypothetical protein